MGAVVLIFPLSIPLPRFVVSEGSFFLFERGELLCDLFLILLLVSGGHGSAFLPLSRFHTVFPISMTLVCSSSY